MQENQDKEWEICIIIPFEYQDEEYELLDRLKAESFYEEVNHVVYCPDFRSDQVQGNYSRAMAGCCRGVASLGANIAPVADEATNVMLDMAGIREGQRVLDVAAGARLSIGGFKNAGITQAKWPWLPG
jgi:hypothetical protein